MTDSIAHRAHGIGLAPYHHVLAGGSGERIALVPTMGALHAGHIALVRKAKRRARRVVVSIFVNPAQFAPHEDFASYPRKFETDLTPLAAAAVDLVWAPPVAVMYPAGIRNADHPGRRGHGGARRQVSSALLRWRGDRGRQALDPVHTRLCHVRREGLSAAQGGHATGGGPRPAGRDRRRARPCARRTASRCLHATPICRRRTGRRRLRCIA